MIFLTIGSHEPFERLIKAMDDWCAISGRGSEVFGQITDHGLSDHPPQHFQAVGRMTPREYDQKFSQADIIVSHAGMGSILTALSKGKPIVVMPRRGHLRETRNDHQYTTATHLGDRPGIFVAEDEMSLGGVLDNTLKTLRQLQQSPVSQVAQPRFIAALREYLLTNTVARTEASRGQNGEESIET